MKPPSGSQRDAVMVTRSTLPPLEEYVAQLRRIWESHVLTNNGPCVQELECKLRDYLEIPQIWFVNNGTTALQIAIKSLQLDGEIITTPFSYVATTGAILWENCTPVFADVRPEDLTIDPDRIEAAITPRTRAILATHVYGFPCEVAAIEEIARRHGLKTIYDAAHAFGCRMGGRSLVAYGDISCLSFHATKVFHTVEGGAIVINGDAGLADRIRLIRAFGHQRDEHRFPGINGKNSEFHAAMGLCNLPHLSDNLTRRRVQHENYTRMLRDTSIVLPRARAQDLEYNYAYFPVLLPDEAALERTLGSLAQHRIYPRRYFYPSLNKIPYVKGPDCPVSEQAARTALCLPMSDLVTPELQTLVVDTLLASARA